MVLTLSSAWDLLRKLLWERGVSPKISRNPFCRNTGPCRQISMDKSPSASQPHSGLPSICNPPNPLISSCKPLLPTSLQPSQHGHEVRIFPKNRTFAGCREHRDWNLRTPDRSLASSQGWVLPAAAGIPELEEKSWKSVVLDTLSQNLGFCLLSFTSFALPSGSCSAWAPHWE